MTIESHAPLIDYQNMSGGTARISKAGQHDLAFADWPGRECMTLEFDRSLASIRTSIAALSLAGALALPVGTAGAQDFVMKFATQTINDMQHEYIKIYKTELEKATNNRIRVDVYPASQLGGAQRQVEGLRLGTIEAAIGPSELFFGADPRFQVLALAGLFKDNEQARRALEVPEFRKAIADFTEPRGLLTIGLNVYDQQVFTFKAPVTKLADFSGKRVRVLASEGEQASVVALGASAVPMALPEVLPAVQQGTIDGANSVIGAFVAFRYYDAAPHMLDTGLWALMPVALVSRAWFNRLPPDLQKLVAETGRKIEPAVHQWQIRRIAEDRKTWTDKGGTIEKLSAAEQQDAIKRVAAAVQSVLAKNASSKELYDKLKKAADGVN
jgi:TRAP-type transport system periplasmic protein